MTTTTTTESATTSATGRRGANAIDILRLHYVKRTMMFAVPAYILAGVLVFSAIISLVFWRAGSEIGSVEWIDGSRSNQGMLWAFAGFMVYMGVQSVATHFPFALTLGSSRRAFTVGTLLSHVALAAYLTILTLGVFAIEMATNHWFIGFYLTDVYILGGGEVGRLVAIQFLGVLTSLSIGAAFAAVWVRFGNRGTTLLGLGLAVASALAVVLLVPYVSEIAASFEMWWLAVAALVVILLAVLVEYGCLRRASVR